MADGTKKGLATNTAFMAQFDKEFNEAKDKGQINPRTTKEDVAKIKLDDDDFDVLFGDWGRNNTSKHMVYNKTGELKGDNNDDDSDDSSLVATDSNDEDEDEDEDDSIDEDEEKLSNRRYCGVAHYPPAAAATSIRHHSNRKKKNTDSEIKQFALTCFHKFDEISKEKCCDRHSDAGECCIQRLSYGNHFQLLCNFWGDKTTPAPTTTERGIKIKQILAQAYRGDGIFEFKVGSTSVCEKAFLTILGLSVSRTDPVPAQWRRIRSEILGKISNTNLLGPSKVKDQRSSKLRDAQAYIKLVAGVMADHSVHKESARYVPYETRFEFFEEYVAFRQAGFHRPGLIAKKSTFYKALDAMKDDVKLLRAKGGFPTCDLCNRANDLLRARASVYNEGQREMILKFKRLHLDQQTKERDDMDNRRDLAKTSFRAGQPTHAFILVDAASNDAVGFPGTNIGNQSRSSKDDRNTIVNRLMTCEVHCGPISTTFVYHTDNTIAHGANYMIEVMRQATADLATALAEKNLILPRKFFWQFDNCGENKNRYLFGYASLLVQALAFESIQINFLIVGHTHCSVDQYFSVLTAIFQHSRFIASPGALHNLLATKPLNVAQRAPLQFQRQIRVVRDYMKVLKPYLNMDIQYFQVPHCFLFTRSRFGLAICQYKLFSSGQVWLPMPPSSTLNEEEFINQRMRALNIRVFSSVANDVDEGHDFLVGSASGALLSTVSTKQDKEASNRRRAFESTFDDLVEVEQLAIAEQAQRYDDQAASGISKQRYEDLPPQYIAEMTARMKKNSTIDKGYLIFLKAKSNNSNQAGASLWNTVPDLVISREIAHKALLLAKEKNATRTGGDDDYDDDDHENNEEVVIDGDDNTDNDDDKVAVEHDEDDIIISSAAVLTDEQQRKTAAKTVKEKAAVHKFYSKANEIANVARRVFKLIQSGRFVVDKTRSTFDYSSNNILTSEDHEYFASRLSAEKVIALHIKAIEELQPFKWFIPTRMTDQQEVERANELASDERKDRELGESMLTRKFQNVGDQTMVVRGQTTAPAPRSKAAQAAQGAPSPAKRRCCIKACKAPAAKAMHRCKHQLCIDLFFCRNHILTHKKHSKLEKKAPIEVPIVLEAEAEADIDDAADPVEEEDDNNDDSDVDSIVDPSCCIEECSECATVKCVVPSCACRNRSYCNIHLASHLSGQSIQVPSKKKHGAKKVGISATSASNVYIAALDNSGSSSSSSSSSSGGNSSSRSSSVGGYSHVASADSNVYVAAVDNSSNNSGSSGNPHVDNSQAGVKEQSQKRHVQSDKPAPKKARREKRTQFTPVAKQCHRGLSCRSAEADKSIGPGYHLVDPQSIKSGERWFCPTCTLANDEANAASIEGKRRRKSTTYP